MQHRTVTANCGRGAAAAELPMADAIGVRDDCRHERRHRGQSQARSGADHEIAAAVVR